MGKKIGIVAIVIIIIALIIVGIYYFSNNNENVENQLKEDMMSDQLTIKEYKDPFKGSK